MRMRYPAFPWVRFAAAPEIREFLLRSGTIREYKKNEVVIPSFYVYPHFSLIVGGVLAKGFDVQGSSKLFSHSVLFPGSVVGTYYFMTKNITNMKIIALRNSKLIEVPHELVYDYMNKDKEFALKILNHTAMDFASDSEGLATVSSRPATEKYKILMKILMIRFNVKPEGGWYKIPFTFTHDELSRIIYTTKITINRILMDGTKNGFFRKEGRDRYIHKSYFDNIYDWNPGDPLTQLQ